MAYSNSPAVQTYMTKRVSFASNPLQRSSDSSKDFRLLNMMVDIVPAGEDKMTYIKSRPGMATVYSTTAGTGRGIYYWNYGGTGYVIHVIGNQLYVNGSAALTLATSTGKVGFTEFVGSLGLQKLIIVDGTNGYVASSPSSVAQIGTMSLNPWTANTTLVSNAVVRAPTDNGYAYRVSVNGTTGATAPTWNTTVGGTTISGGVTFITEQSAFPSPHIPTPIFLDGYIFLPKSGTQDIYNSDVNDPNQWTPGSYISAEMYPDRLVGLSKNNNYLYAVGAQSIEYYYDVANVVGSPLGRQQSAVQQFGCPAFGTIVQTEKEVVMVGETSDGGHTVWLIDGFNATEVGIPAVKSSLLAQGVNLVNAVAFGIRVSGQKLYILNLYDRTWVYSFNTKLWSEWVTDSTTTFTGFFGTDGPNGSSYILDKTNGKVYTMDETQFTDGGTAITCQIVSAKMDFDTMNRKFMYRLTMIGDVPSSTDNAVSIEYSDDDYATWSTPRTLTFTRDLPTIHQLGQFRRRAFRITYSLPRLLRLEGMEVDINKGSV